MEFTVGQIVYKASNTSVWTHVDNAGPPLECVIEKIGRQWVYLKENAGRFDKFSLEMDAGQYASYGRVYLTLKELKSYRETRMAWKKFYDLMQRCYSPPATATLAQIQNATRSLFPEAK